MFKQDFAGAAQTGRRACLSAAFGWLLAPAAQASQGEARSASPAAPRIVASFSLLADVCRALAPAASQVHALVGTDADAHVFEPSPADGRRLAQADLVVINGLGFEGWMERLVRVSGYRGPVVLASQGVPTRSGPEGTDPHIWQDLGRMRWCVQNIAQALVQRWPQQRADILQRRDAYLERMAQLDTQVRAWLDSLPRAQRRVITSHDAFGYFGAAYGVDFLAPQAWNTHSEPSAAAVGRLIRQIRQQGARALFVENISDPRLIERIAHEAGVKVGGTLYSDALSALGGPADSYLHLFEHNARTLAKALGATLER